MRALAAILLLIVSVHLLAQPQPAWIDPSPHTVRLVPVEPGTTVEVLDWGGSGRTLVLLAQLGQTAHLHDDWAPKLARSYHVLGITRRGHGESALAPDAGMSTDRLGTDIVAVLDALKVPSPVLVGHGFAGEEMSWVGSRHANRLGGLIYVDAAYDRTKIAEEGAIARRIPAAGGGAMRPEDMASPAALTRWMSGNIGFPLPESEVRQIARFGPDGRAMGERMPQATRTRALAEMMPVDYSTIRVPALALFAKRTVTDVSPGCRTPADESVRQACGELFDWTSQQLARSQAMVKTIGARTEIVDLPGTNAFVFLAYERDVTLAIDRFAATLR
ncbi:MAG TPA: alpha/beta hydrolase [Vicinamibacterales bacterium]|nr:alpha/beta hydrolase [Vicinamibacterales bacterium]